jgi:hypothetical protein
VEVVLVVGLLQITDVVTQRSVLMVTQVVRDVGSLTVTMVPLV